MNSKDRSLKKELGTLNFLEITQSPHSNSMHKIKLFLAFLLTTGSIFSARESNFRTFSDSQGREMSAKLIQVSGEDIYIERLDGLSTRVNISIFSKEDQEFIRDWKRKETIKNDAIKVRFITDIEDKSGWKDNLRGVLVKTWKESYGIELSNESQLDLKNIRIEYLVFKFEDAMAAQKRSEGEVRKISDETKFPTLKAGSKAHVSTKKFPMLETKLALGYKWESGGKETSEDEMRGIWIKVFVGEILATEASKPENLMHKKSWPTSKSK